MMNNLLDENVDVSGVELAETDNQYWVNQNNALGALKNKPYFKTLIEEGYFKDYVFELVMMLTDRGVVAEGRRNAIIERLVGVAKLQDYFGMVSGLSFTEDAYNEEVDKRYASEKGRLVKLAAALDAAEKDKDFKLLVIDSYCNNYAASQTSLITNEQVIRSGHRTDVLEALAGISTLRNYLIDIKKDLAEFAEPENDDDSEE